MQPLLGVPRIGMPDLGHMLGDDGYAHGLTPDLDMSIWPKDTDDHLVAMIFLLCSQALIPLFNALDVRVESHEPGHGPG